MVPRGPSTPFFYDPPPYTDGKIQEGRYFFGETLYSLSRFKDHITPLICDRITDGLGDCYDSDRLVPIPILNFAVERGPNGLGWTCLWYFHCHEGDGRAFVRAVRTLGDMTPIILPLIEKATK